MPMDKLTPVSLGARAHYCVRPRGNPASPRVAAKIGQMSAIMLMAGLALGMIIGAVIGYLYAGRRVAAATERARAAEERAALVDGGLAERFQSLSAQALDASSARFLEMAEGRLENPRARVEPRGPPPKETVARVEAQLPETDGARRASHAPLAEQVNLS